METNLAAELAPEEILELAEAEAEEALLEATLVMDVWAWLKLAISEEREEIEAVFVSVARTLLREAPREPADERAEFAELVMEAMADEALDCALLMIDDPLARAELIPDSTADEAELAELRELVS